MFNRKAEFDEITLRWKAFLYDDDSQIISTSEKPPHLTLKEFIKATEENGQQLFLDYIINGVSLADWLNLNYFERKAIGPIHSYQESLGCIKNPCYRKILLKRLFGIKITEQDAFDAANYHRAKHKRSEEQLKREQENNKAFAHQILDDEAGDTMLYCSGCCGDRACGYFGIGVSQFKDTITWFASLGAHSKLKFSFKLEQYTEAFMETITMINHDLIEQDYAPCSLNGAIEQGYHVNDYANIVAKKYNLNKASFSRPQLNEIFKAGSIKEIDSSLFLVQSFGYDLALLKEEVEALYLSLPEADKNGIEWRIIDGSSYWSTIDLFQPTIAKKILLLYSQ